MLQNTEYKAGSYLHWYWRTRDFATVVNRRRLDKTMAARLLLTALQSGILLQLGMSAVFLVRFITTGDGLYLLSGALLLVTYPVIWAHLVVVPLMFGEVVIVRPKQKKLIEQSRTIFADSPATTIAIAGSYGKTSMKEILNTVLSQGKKVAATPANRNVSSSHAEFASSLKGTEEILIIEYGEGRPGDVARFCDITRPNIGVITGLAPAHLDEYKTLDAAGKDIFRLADYLRHKDVYVNGESKAAHAFIQSSDCQYTGRGVLNWRVSDIKQNIEGIHFTLEKTGRSLHLSSGLLGRHQLGPLSLAVALADKLGLSDAQIKDGIARTKPFEHRMQPYPLGGAWIIDDSYNGNIDGIRAGLQLLAELSAKRKIYVSPGLVDQGEETEKIHLEMGRLIGKAEPDLVVLMRNSVTAFIRRGLTEANYRGALMTEENPLSFYTNLDQFVAAGDLIMLQNDWTDNYV